MSPSTAPVSAGPSTSAAAKGATSRAEAAHDAILVQRFNAGDQSAFDEIVLRYREKLFAIALGVLRNRADAEEIASDTFIRAYRGLAKFRGDSSLVTWLHRVTVNLARNRYWYYHRRRQHDTLSLDHPLSAESDATFADLMPSPDAQPARDAIREEFVGLISECMEKLPARHREILEMRNVLNRSYEEIASTLGIEVGTVKSRIARARGQLRSLMTESCPDLGENALPPDWFEVERPTGQLRNAAA